MTNSRTTSPAGEMIVISCDARPAHVRQSPSQLIGGSFGTSAAPVTLSPAAAERLAGTPRSAIDPNPDMPADTRGIAIQLATGRRRRRQAGTGCRTRVPSEHLTDSYHNAYFCDAPTRRTDLTFMPLHTAESRSVSLCGATAAIRSGGGSRLCVCAAPVAPIAPVPPPARGGRGTRQPSAPLPT
jgi:hypothetical protein